MFIRKNASSEIAEEMEKSLISNAAEKETAGFTKMAEAADLLNRAAEIFEEIGLTKQADVAVYLLESLAGKKKVKKKKPVKKKKSDPATKGLTSEKMVENLAHKGWVFNADDGFADDTNDMKLGIAGGLGSADAFYWKHCAVKAINEGKLEEAQRCLDKAKTIDEIDDYEDANRINNVDDVEFQKDENEQDLARMMHQLEEEDWDRSSEWEDELDPLGGELERVEHGFGERARPFGRF